MSTGGIVEEVQSWTLPWACRECRRHGLVDGIIVALGARTTDDQLRDKLDRAHLAENPACINRVDRLLLGRLSRMEFGERIWLLREGETGQGRPSRWPPWGEG